MGFCFSWLAVRGKEREQVLAELGLAEVRPIEGEFLFEQTYAATTLRCGWFGVFMNDFAHDFLSDKSLRSLSKNADVLGCMAYDTVMDSSSQLWRSGEREWLVRHNGQIGPDDLQVLGRPTGGRLECLRAWALQRSREHSNAGSNFVDYMYEVPLLLAFRETGFKESRASKIRSVFHEMTFESAASNSQTGHRAKPFWKFW
jgi:hypothetical protein